MYNGQKSIYNSVKNFAFGAALYTGLAGIIAGTSMTTAGCGPKRKKVYITVPGQPPTPNGAPTLDSLTSSYSVVAGQTLIIPLTGRDDFSPGTNNNGVITPAQPLDLQALPGTTDTRFTVVKLTETIANPLRVVTGNATYVSPANDTPGQRSYVVQLTDGDLSDVEVVNITVTPAPGAPGGGGSTGQPGTGTSAAPGGGGTSGQPATGNP